MNIAYGVCVGSWEKFQRYVVPRVGNRPLLGISGQSSIAMAYNAIMDALADSVPDVLVLLHDDLEMIDPDTEEKLEEIFKDQSIGIVGVAGSTSECSLAWWNSDPIGHQQTDVMNIDFGIRSGKATALEGSFLALSQWAIYNSCFDPIYPGFHGYDVDICSDLRKMGKKVWVADIDTHHHTSMGFKSEESQSAWLEADRIYREKWNA